jgi:hypothetical protein
MRMLWLLGIVGGISTAHAQPAAPAAPALMPPGLTPPGLTPPGGIAAPVAPAVSDSDSDADAQIESYRWKIALADATCTVLMLSGTEHGGSIGALGYLLVGPVIHGANDEGGRMAASLALRVGLPLLGGFGFVELASASRHCAADDEDCGDDEGALFAGLFGVGLGMLTAMIIDTTVLARPHVVRKDKPRVTWAPRISLTSQRTSLGILGRF